MNLACKAVLGRNISLINIIILENDSLLVDRVDCKTAEHFNMAFTCRAISRTRAPFFECPSSVSDMAQRPILPPHHQFAQVIGHFNRRQYSRRSPAAGCLKNKNTGALFVDGSLERIDLKIEIDRFLSKR